MITVSCSNCGKTSNAPDSAAGKKGRCSCGSPISVPVLAKVIPVPDEADSQGILPLPVADEEPIRRRKVSRKSSFLAVSFSVWPVGKWVALAIGCLFAYMGYESKNILQTAAASGLACFCGIVSRILQAEEHQYEVRSRSK